MAEASLLFHIRASDEASAVAKSTADKMIGESRRVSEEGKLEELNKSLGRGSTAFELAHLAEGKGPLIAMTLISQQLGEMATKASEVGELIASGESGWTEIAVKIGESLPVIGAYVTAGQAIREAITHENAELKASIELEKTRSEVLDQQLALRREMARESIEADQVAERIAQREKTIGMVGPGARFQGLQNSQQNEKEAAASALESKIEGQRKELEAEKEKINEQIINAVTPEEGLGLTWQRNILELQFQKHEAEQRKTLAEEDKQRDAVGAKEQIQARKDFAEEEQNEVARSGLALASIQDKVANERLRKTGELYTGEAAIIRNAMKEQIEILDEAHNKRVKEIKSDADSGLITRDQEREKFKQESERHEKYGSVLLQGADIQTQDAQNKAAKESAETQVSINQTRIAGMEAGIAAGDKTLELAKAELEITDQYAERRQKIQDMIDGETTPAQKRLLEVEKQQLDTQEAIAQIHQTNVGLQNASRMIVEQEASTGNRLAEVELKRFDITKKFREERQQLLGIEKDGATEEQRAKAKAMLATLDAEEKRALGLAGIGGLKMEALAGTQSNVGGGISGLAMAAKEQALGFGKGFGRGPLPGLVDADAATPKAPPPNANDIAQTDLLKGSNQLLNRVVTLLAAAIGGKHAVGIFGHS